MFQMIGTSLLFAPIATPISCMTQGDAHAARLAKQSTHLDWRRFSMICGIHLVPAGIEADAR